jgi:hypothetical protein
VAITPLQRASELARKHQNIDLVLKPFVDAKFFVLAARFPDSAEPQFYVKSAPTPKRLAVTASESPDRLSSIPDAVLVEMTGRELLEKLEPDFELVIVYDKGGEHLSREQLAWLRELLKVQSTP